MGAITRNAGSPAMLATVTEEDEQLGTVVHRVDLFVDGRTLTVDTDPAGKSLRYDRTLRRSTTTTEDGAHTSDQRDFPPNYPCVGMLVPGLMPWWDRTTGTMYPLSVEELGEDRLRVRFATRDSPGGTEVVVAIMDLDEREGLATRLQYWDSIYTLTGYGMA